MINQVLEVEKIDAEIITIEDFASLDNTIKLALKRLQPQIEDLKVDLIYNGSSKHDMIKLDEDKLLQVMLNLLSNALKFCASENGIIRIGLKINELERSATLSVYNNGQHIAKEFQHTIFEKFTQVKDGNLAKPEGSGLGLYITRKFVEQAGGQVSFDSSEKGGTTFYLNFPLHNEEKS